MNSLNVATLLSDRRSFLRVANGPEGSTYQKWLQNSPYIICLYLSTLLKNITVALVIIARSPWLAEHVWKISRRMIQFKWGHTRLIFSRFLTAEFTSFSWGIIWLLDTLAWLHTICDAYWSSTLLEAIIVCLIIWIKISTPWKQTNSSLQIVLFGLSWDAGQCVPCPLQ